MFEDKYEIESATLALAVTLLDEFLLKRLEITAKNCDNIIKYY